MMCCSKWLSLTCVCVCVLGVLGGVDSCVLTLALSDSCVPDDRQAL